MIVTIELNASGIAATAKATAIIRASKKFFEQQIIEVLKQKNKEAILPISVCIPMSQTIYFPVPWFTRLSEKTMFFV